MQNINKIPRKICNFYGIQTDINKKVNSLIKTVQVKI